MTTQPINVGELATLVSGQLTGDGAIDICGAAVLSEVLAGQITLVDQLERVKELASTQAAAVVVPTNIDCHWPAVIRVDDIHTAFSKIISYFRPVRTQTRFGISPHSAVSQFARLGQNVDIHPNATVGDDCEIGDGTTVMPGAQILAGCVIGRDAMIGPSAVLYENTVVGDRAIVHGGAVLGAHGFGYQQAGGRHVLSAQLGYVRVGNDVEIGAGTTIDRGTYGATTIGEGTKIDNLVQIAHNCQIGRHNLICSQVGIAGSTTTGDYVVMGGQAGIRDHVRIGSRVILAAMSGITNDIPDGAVMLGIPATPEREQKLKQAALAKLPEMRKEFKTMRRAILELEKAVGIAPERLGDVDQAA